MPDPMPGRALVTRRAVRDVVRTAVMASYGVTGLGGGGELAALLERLGLPHPGLRVELEPELVVELHLTVGYGLPVAEVARQVEASVRWALAQALGREPDRIRIRIDGLRDEPVPAPVAPPAEVAPGDLAASGTDVA